MKDLELPGNHALKQMEKTLRPLQSIAEQLSATASIAEAFRQSQVGIAEQARKTLEDSPTTALFKQFEAGGLKTAFKIDASATIRAADAIKKAAVLDATTIKASALANIELPKSKMFDTILGSCYEPKPMTPSINELPLVSAPEPSEAANMANALLAQKEELETQIQGSPNNQVIVIATLADGTRLIVQKLKTVGNDTIEITALAQREGDDPRVLQVGVKVLTLEARIFKGQAIKPKLSLIKNPSELD